MLPIGMIVGLFMLLMAALQALPAGWQQAIRYDRAAIAAGQWWRLLTGHFIHLGWTHLALNLAGLGLGTWLFGADRSPGQWLVATLVVAAGCSLGLYGFAPAVGWCVGLSGILHGFMIIGFGGWVLAGERWAALLLAAVIAKMAWEQMGGEMPWAASLAGGQVVTAAHVWGAAGGGLYLAGEALWCRWRRSV
ncbi:MAG: rhombosortase [Gammaproteobacteria bacterium]